MKSPKIAEIYFNRGAAKGMLIPVDFKGAIADYNRAIQLNPEYMEAYANRGVAKINLILFAGESKSRHEDTSDACWDLNKVTSLGNAGLQEVITEYCKKQ